MLTLLFLLLRQLILSLLGVGQLLPSDSYMEYVAEKWCDSESTIADMCYNFLFIIAGPDSEELNEVRYIGARGG